MENFKGDDTLEKLILSGMIRSEFCQFRRYRNRKLVTSKEDVRNKLENFLPI